MQHVIETLDGWVPSDFSPKAMRWMPPENAVVVRERLDAEALASAVELGEVVPEPAR
ncbi:hypothetical protein ABGB07_02250 [Micromonosporaceae bacterium B7E4]